MTSSNDGKSYSMTAKDEKWNIDPFSVGELEDMYLRMQIMNGEEMKNYISSIRQRVVESELKQGNCLMDSSPNYTVKSVEARIKTVPECKTRITFYGANSSGKSTLLQSLVVGSMSDRFLPSRSGLVTGRICEITYCRPEEASVSVIPLYINSEKAKTYHLDVNASLGPQLSQYLERPDDWSATSRWSKYIVRIQWPFSGLKNSNVEFVDLPGFSTSSDLPEIKSNVNYYLTRTEMHGVVFCYDRPIFADDAINAFSELKNLLLKRQKIRGDSILPIFFASTKFNFISAMEANAPLNQEIRQLAQKRWDLLGSAAKKHIALGIADHIDIHVDFRESENWSMTCAGTFLKRNDEDFEDVISHINGMHSHFMTHLLRWMIQIKANFQIRYLNLLITNSTAFYERSLLATNKLRVEEKKIALSTIDKYTSKVLAFCKSVASRAGDCFTTTLRSQELREQIYQHFEPFAIENAPEYAPVAFSDPVKQAADALAKQYGLQPLPASSPFRLSVYQFTLDISKFLAKFAYQKCFSTYCDQWINEAIEILTQHFPRPGREMTILHRALGNIVNLNEFFRGLQEGYKTVGGQKVDSFPEFLQNLGFNSLLQHLKRYITEQLQKTLAKHITVQAFEQNMSTASIINSCLLTAKLLPFTNLQQILCSIMSKMSKKLCDAVEHETEVTSSWTTRIPAFRECMLYEHHAISIAQCWNACQLYNALSDRDRFPTVSSLKYRHNPPSSPHIFPPIISSLCVPSFGYELIPDPGNLQHPISELSASYLAILVNMIELYRSIPCYKSSSILFPSYIHVWYDFKTSKLAATETYENTHSALPLQSSDVVNVLGAAIETVQIMFNTSGQQHVHFPATDVTVLAHKPHYLVGRATLCTHQLVHTNILQRAPITNSSKLEIIEALARELVTSTAQVYRNSDKCPIEEFSTIWLMLNDPKSKLDEDGTLQQILAHLKELRF